ncbi:986_t:CDS:10 [Entrophospora sp. SA101]|nr:986_t:CDS:10 [Entrophospora sp. SA101]
MGTVVNAGSWTSLEPKLKTLATIGFLEMTPVQASTIPLFMKSKDVVVELSGVSKGSGKTLAFVIPIIEKLVNRKHRLRKNEIGALVITPTRELAQQISTTNISEDIEKFKEIGPDILIGTPGRLHDLIVGRNTGSRNNNTSNSISIVNTKELEILVLDEADRLLDMGFSENINTIMLHLPRQRRTGLFSATMTDGLSEIVRAGLRNPVRVVVKVEDVVTKNEQRTPATLQIGYILCEPHQKLSQLIRLMKSEKVAKKYIIYFSTCACVDYFYKIFVKLPQFSGVSIHSLHGKMDTKRRTARGLDVPDVDYVIQVDPPQDPKVFSHRCGRTARAGKEGKAMVFLGIGREEVYIEIPKIDKENDELLEQIRKIVLTDRDLHDKGTKAFVSYVRSYSKHEASYIFRLKDLDLGKVAKGFGLLKLPRMPELANAKIGFDEMDEYKYADSIREKKRKEKLLGKKSTKSTESELISLKKKRQLIINDSWSDKKLKKQRKTERKVKKENKKNSRGETINKHNKIDGDDDLEKDEWDELQKEERLIKKLKKGKISQEEFDKQFGDF